MGIIIWAAVAGALLNWMASDFSAFGFVLGAMMGAVMGAWLRSALRLEIRMAVERAVAGLAPPPAPEREVTEPPARPLPEPIASAPVAPEPAAFRPAAPAPPIPATEPVIAYEAPAPGLIEVQLAKARDWLLGGNTIVRAGLAILFLGLVFLARLAVSAGFFPIEARLATVGLFGVALLVIGLRKRVERPPFALSLQGGGVAVLYLVIFAAAKVYTVMPPVAALGFMVLFAALGCALALLQDSLAMALISFLGGFAVPVLIGGDSETPLGLFAYMTILNLAIFVIAWRKSWRPLNLLGFVATFALATLWGFTGYEDRHYLICQVFLLIWVALYLATSVLYAHNTPGKLGNYADSTLLFGTALVGFGLQVGLVHDHPFGAAFSALGFGAAYVATAAAMMRTNREGMRLVNECLLAIGIGFATLAVPLALDAQWTASTWVLEGAGAFWIGARQARWMPRAFGLLLQVAGAIIALGALQPTVAALPIANGGFLLYALVAAPLMLTAWLMRDPLAHSGSTFARVYEPVEQGLRHAWFLAGFGFACLAIVVEATRLLPPATTQSPPMAVLPVHGQIYAVLLGILAAMAAAQVFGLRRAWSVATFPARLSLPLMTVCLLSITIDGRHVLYWPDLLCWIAAVGVHAWMLRRQPLARWTHAMHAGGVLFVTVMVVDSLFLAVDRADLWDTSWAGAVFLVSATAMLLALTRWAGRAAGQGGTAAFAWPLDPFARAYWWHAALVLAVLVYGGALISTLLAEGVTDPLPYVPLLNAVDLSALLALAALALWRRMLATCPQPPAGARPLLGGAGLAAGAVLAFAIANTVWLRTAHHFLGIAWERDTLAGSQVVQSGYSLLWTLIAMGLMLFAHRRAQRLCWLAGAVLLGVVVAKLFFVDMSRVAGIARIVAFIGVGLLMLLVGYFVPLPPRDRAVPERAT